MGVPLPGASARSWRFARWGAGGAVAPRQGAREGCSSRDDSECCDRGEVGTCAREKFTQYFSRIPHPLGGLLTKPRGMCCSCRLPANAKPQFAECRVPTTHAGKSRGGVTRGRQQRTWQWRWQWGWGSSHGVGCWRVAARTIGCWGGRRQGEPCMVEYSLARASAAGKCSEAATAGAAAAG